MLFFFRSGLDDGSVGGLLKDRALRILGSMPDKGVSTRSTPMKKVLDEKVLEKEAAFWKSLRKATAEGPVKRCLK
jgi:hypothetical protein